MGLKRRDTIGCDTMGREGEKGGPSMSGGVPEQGPAARRWWCRRRTRSRRRRRTGWTLGNARYVHAVRGDRVCVCVCVSHTHSESFSLSPPREQLCNRSCSNKHTHAYKDPDENPANFDDIGFRLRHMSSARSTSDGRGPVTHMGSGKGGVRETSQGRPTWPLSSA